jgi:hypothetical protein
MQKILHLRLANPIHFDRGCRIQKILIKAGLTHPKVLSATIRYRKNSQKCGGAASSGLTEAGTEAGTAQNFDFALFWSAQDTSLLVDAKITARAVQGWTKYDKIPQQMATLHCTGEDRQPGAELGRSDPSDFAFGTSNPKDLDRVCRNVKYFRSCVCQI